MDLIWGFQSGIDLGFFILLQKMIKTLLFSTTAAHTSAICVFSSPFRFSSSQIPPLVSSLQDLKPALVMVTRSSINVGYSCRRDGGGLVVVASGGYDFKRNEDGGGGGGFCFGCLEAIDGTYIEIPNKKKRHIATNVLKVLADARYINDEGFLAPYRGTSCAPTTKEEYFNMKHSHARTIMERTHMIIDPYDFSNCKMVDHCGRKTNEEDLLIKIQDIVINGGRGDNGSIRLGTYEAVVSKSVKKIPSISMTSKHVQNKVMRLKHKHSAAYDMLISVFGCNDANQCATVEAQEILEEYLGSITLFRLKLVFGKDHATKHGRIRYCRVGKYEHIKHNVPTILSPSSTTSRSSFPGEGKATTTNQIKKLVAVISDSAPKMDSLSNELKGLGLELEGIQNPLSFFLPAANPHPSFFIVCLLPIAYRRSPERRRRRPPSDPNFERRKELIPTVVVFFTVVQLATTTTTVLDRRQVDTGSFWLRICVALAINLTSIFSSLENVQNFETIHAHESIKAYTNDP
ncbi:hypothetical protein OSB04_012212 [Centaurea solstitialis]|uniref:Uncharacterized protein n=1 Tax=Centaurea solstitialis TaxID=347529 RepID=A0AA38TII4_9ASTR|nr:hypothetical protein OSB04_012212 [Centaurea solstitialis]